jgi:hypothetical protein
MQQIKVGCAVVIVLVVCAEGWAVFVGCAGLPWSVLFLYPLIQHPTHFIQCPPHIVQCLPYFIQCPPTFPVLLPLIQCTPTLSGGPPLYPVSSPLLASVEPIGVHSAHPR